MRPATSVGVGLTAALCAVAWTDGAGAWHEPLRYGVALMLLAAAAAIANDLLDAHRDARVRMWRPIPAATISTTAARVVAILLGAGGLAVAATLGWQPLIVAAALVITGAVYSYAWRGAVGGVAAFALSAVLIPLGAALVGGTDSGGPIWWVAPVGAATGLAFFIAYKLPEFERDDEDGARNILHWASIDVAVPMAWAGRCRGARARAVVGQYRRNRRDLGGGAVGLAAGHHDRHDGRAAAPGHRAAAVVAAGLALPRAFGADGGVARRDGAALTDSPARLFVTLRPITRRTRGP